MSDESLSDFVTSESEDSDTKPVAARFRRPTVWEVDAFLDTVSDSIPGRPQRKRASVFDYTLPTRPAKDPPPAKKWTWHGRVTISTARGIETVCEVATLTDATDAPPPRLASFIFAEKELRLTAFYDVADILLLLPAFKPPHQFALLAAPGSRQFDVLGRFLESKQMAAVVPALWDGERLGRMLFVPPAAKGALAALRPPRAFYRTDGVKLIVVLLFDHHPERDDPLPRNLNHMKIERFLPREDWRYTLQIDRGFHLALRVLRLPRAQLDLALKCAAVAWLHSTADPFVARDTQHLLHILDRSAAGAVAPDDPAARIVFIHVADLAHVHALPLLAARRRRPDVRLCVYGAHPALSPARWGCREVYGYGLGGIVTFTADALLTDPWAVLRTIRAIDRHPLWACYVMPQIVGLALRLDEDREAALLAHMGMPPLAWDRLFEAVRDGRVALMRTPPAAPTALAARQWVLEHVLLRPLTAAAARARCISACAAAYDVEPDPRTRWPALAPALARARDDVQADMRRVQSTPVFAEEYCRFVVFDVYRTATEAWDGKDGIEWKIVGTLDL